MLLTSLYFVSDVQISDSDPYPANATAPIAARLGSEVVYDAGDVAEHAWPAEYETYRALYPRAVPVPGNHDWYSPGLATWPWGTLVDVIDQGVHIVGVDTGIRSNPAAMLDLQARLTSTDLPTVLYLHHPLFSANTRVGAIASTIKASFLPTVQAAHVDLVISGHSHAYERHEFEGQVFVVIGTAGAHLDTLGASPTLVASATRHGWFEVEATEGGLSCTFRGTDGSAIDAFTVPRRVTTPTKSTTWGDVKAMYRDVQRP
jgi:3',5'-cyclic AMP phosphodiesterase CpdA